MISNIHRNWLAKHSFRQEQFGVKPSTPLTAIQYQLEKETDERNMMLKYVAENMSSNILEGIENATEAFVGSIENGFSILYDINQQGFEQISNDLNRIDDTLIDISNILSWGFGEIIEQIKTTNILLSNITDLLKIPEFQKESTTYIEEGLKKLKIAHIKPERYNDALNYFNKAEKIANDNYFLLQKIGFIYFYSEKHEDYNKSLSYFLKSADYSSDLLINTDNDLTDNKYIEVKNYTFISYLYASRSSYALKNYKDALKYIDKALLLVPKSKEAKYDKAKYLSVVEKNEQALNIINSLIINDRFITLKVLGDLDLISKPLFFNHIIDISKYKCNELKEKLNIFNKNVDNYKLNEQIKNIKEFTKSKNYVQCDIGLEKLNLIYEYNIDIITKTTSFYKISKETKSLRPENAYKYITNTQDNLDFIRNVSNLINTKNTLKSKLEIYSNQKKDKVFLSLNFFIAPFFLIITIIFLFVYFNKYGNSRGLNAFGNFIAFIALLGWFILFLYYSVKSVKEHNVLNEIKRVTEHNKKIVLEKALIPELKNDLNQIEKKLIETNYQNIINNMNISFLNEILLKKNNN